MTATIDAPVEAAEQPAPPPPLDRRVPVQRDEIVDRVIDEAAGGDLVIDADEALAFVHFLEFAAMEMRRCARDHGCTTAEYPYHLYSFELERFHDLLTIVMPAHQVEAEPGSAHAMLNSFICRGDEFGLVHTIDGDKVVFCAVAIAMDMNLGML